MKLKYFITAMLYLLWLLPASAQTSLQAYIDTALKNNPSLKAYNFQSDAFQKSISPVKKLDDPMLYVGIMNVPNNFSFTQDMMTMKQIGFSQNFSVKKKYRLKGSIAQKEYEASIYDVTGQKLELIYRLKQQYYDLYANARAIEVMRSSIDVMKNYIEIANTRYSIGQGTQQDVFKAQVELTKMQDELIKMQSMQNDMMASFNTLLARNPLAQVDVVKEIKYMPMDLSMDSLLKEAQSNNPMLLAAKTYVSKDSVSYELTKTSKIPDFNAGAYYGQRQAILPDGDKAKDMVGFTFGLTLPVWSKQKQNPLIEKSFLEIKRSESQLDAMKNEIKLMLHHAMIEADKNKQLVSLYEKQLIPQATENVNAGVIGYQQNKIDFMTLTDNFISLYTYKLQLQQTIADYYEAISELEMLTGKKLNTQ